MVQKTKKNFILDREFMTREEASEHYRMRENLLTCAKANIKSNKEFLAQHKIEDDQIEKARNYVASHLWKVTLSELRLFTVGSIEQMLLKAIEGQRGYKR